MGDNINVRILAQGKALPALTIIGGPESPILITFVDAEDAPGDFEIQLVTGGAFTNDAEGMANVAEILEAIAEAIRDAQAEKMPDDSPQTRRITAGDVGLFTGNSYFNDGHFYHVTDVRYDQSGRPFGHVFAINDERELRSEEIWLDGFEKVTDDAS